MTLAQSAADAVPFAPLIAQVGLAGVFAWFLWYMLTTMFPKLIDGFRAEMAEARVAFRKELQDERQFAQKLYDDARAEMARMQADKMLRLSRIEDRIEGMSANQNATAKVLAETAAIIRDIEDSIHQIAGVRSKPVAEKTK